MNIIRFFVHKPVTVAVGVILLVMFGLIGFQKLAIQLTPDVETPLITVNTAWYGATPYEIEKEIIEKQEKVLKGLQGLSKMESSSYNGLGAITLSFKIGTNLDDALLRVSNKMSEVGNYPENVTRPTIESSGANSSPIIWMILKTAKGNKGHINEFKTFFEDNVRQHLERVEGVGSLLVFGGTDTTLDVIIDAQKMARYNVSINQIIASIQRANQNISAGILGMAKKNYRIRTISQFQTPDDALDVVIFDDGINRVYLRDVARVEKGYKKEDASVLHSGVQVVVVAVRKEKGANVLSMTDAVEKEVSHLNKTILADNELILKMVYDQRPYIHTATNLVKRNILIGSILAIGVLLLFLRSLRTTLITGIAIPISAIGCFVFLWLLGRNLNVVSMAGISFAVGMLVDNAIVVLENIDRHRKTGKNAFDAAYEGTKEVWGAIFASTATTVAVFLPVIFIQEEAGQLFRDIAIAITSSIFLSLIVSISVIPTLFNLFYRKKNNISNGRMQQSVVGRFLAGVILKLSTFCMKNTLTRLATIILFTSLSIGLTSYLLPSAEYLPQGNRNLILNILIPPPGYSVEKLKSMGKNIYKATEPYFKEDGKDGFPMIKHMFFVGADRITLFGGISTHETRASELIPLFRRVMSSIPGVFGVSIQAGIFESGIGKGRTVDVNISGNGMDDIIQAAYALFGTITKKMENTQVRPVPSLEASYPEVKIVPNREKLAANGLTARELGIYVDILMDGRKIEEYRPEGIKQLDLVLKGRPSFGSSPEDILNSTIVNRFGDLIRVRDVAGIEYGQGMPQINHLERDRNITLQVTPPADLALQTAMELIENDILPALEKTGKLKNVNVSVGGNADKLVETRQALQWNLLLALVITYLLMAALFENFLYPFIILFTIPLAAAGGLVGLFAVNKFIAPQGFDVLSMLGFIILIGTVVNNAILIVHQSLNNVRYNGLIGKHAVADAVKTRIRPIFMSASTSLLAMLPMVLSTGSGSELYRGLGSILLGGLAMSTVFTLFVIPSLLVFVIGFETNKIKNPVQLS
ncbi:MAG: efflux RND transporter permease subunit [Desulfobacula sp.]|jgi:hydrophobic/amphiphilic exporter-1 (mainly G- bacteria), HAE1 family|uniref:efflux RND transporter permease subunit n=1 Tax=Desulfobacula sp. TaxID=2593537 RepID=UPI001D2A3F0B|nr:efflux RND transporter permease subunit [Desulfobacula sp.]MBT3484941.1 efflux RND transporter permease subunit [Desulfobacula sp.]MBT3803223.1 efflux RND transporter permease subunit [Desulfobacula sp.]MBT4024606.1 efflux RND transporter permease subunit [Desulfobacula sp.]MBT4197570.1 efflux RND transporter permease subunit [Desulfobacula sp.]